ncbi:alpha/beta hydrolase [Crossiella sp. CA-258035]|uniref:alpha/beta fold hydrolase n=1 Tax=Crossiella sp. CA-258035 TaxID=2981138 RepID=UPI0024BCF9E9|nr:alpha/beta hydrolase [Crossiella sp. CA-258035]WHT21396.1 alpha/beta hydrolase [Crossiella sp. CA-258035]
MRPNHFRTLTTATLLALTIPTTATATPVAAATPVASAAAARSAAIAASSAAATAAASPATAVASTSVAAPPTSPPTHPCATATQQCDGTLDLPLNWSDPTGERIPIPFTFHPRTDQSRPAEGTVLALGGGPASSLGGAIEGHRRALGAESARFNVLAVERRGFGRAAPFACPDLDLTTPQTVADCTNGIGPRLQFFTTDQRVTDVDAVRAALGIPALTLYGTSYGTRDATAYAVRFPQRTKAIIADSAMPVNAEGYAVGDTFNERLRVTATQLTAVCAPSPACRALPGTPASRWSDLMTRLRAHPDPKLPLFALNDIISKPGEPSVGREINAAIAAYLADDPAPLHRLAATGPTLPPRGSPFTAPFFAFWCADSAYPFSRTATPEVRRQELARYRQANPERPVTAAEVMGAFGWAEDWCAHWPTPRPTPLIPPGTALPDVPLLAIGGQLDLGADQAARTLAASVPRGRALIVPFGQHVPSITNYGYSPCAAHAVRTFLTNPAKPTPPCTAENYQAQAHFPRTTDNLPTPHAPALSREHRTALAVALSTANDALARRNPNTALQVNRKQLPGVRGGTIHFENPQIRLDHVQHVTDAGVTGTITIPAQHEEATATLTVTHNGKTTELRLRWNPFHVRQTLKIQGTADNASFTATFPNAS